MRSYRFGILAMTAICVACGGQQGPTDDGQAIKTDLNSSIAGKTYRCTTDGPASQMTFGNDGKITGQLLDTPASGSWFSRGTAGVEVYVSTGSIAIRDVLKPRGGGWAGRNIRCS